MNLKAGVIGLIGGGVNSTVASVRIARYIAHELEVPCIFPGSDGAIKLEAFLKAKPRTIIIVNGPLLYVTATKGPFCDLLVEAVRTVPNVVWAQNDYTMPPPSATSSAQSPFRKAFGDRRLVPHYWTTCLDNEDTTRRSAYVNWNLLGYEPQPLRTRGWKPQLLYYGAFREGRRSGFDRFFEKQGRLNVTVSSTSKKFAEQYGIGVKVIPPFQRTTFHHDIAQYGFGLFMEDKRSRGGRHSPPTRFYEMLSAGLPMLFEPESARGLEIWGHHVQPYVVEDVKEALAKMKNRTHIQHVQASAWRKDYRYELRNQLRKAVGKMEKGVI